MDPSVLSGAIGRISNKKNRYTWVCGVGSWCKSSKKWIHKTNQVLNAWNLMHLIFCLPLEMMSYPNVNISEITEGISPTWSFWKKHPWFDPDLKSGMWFYVLMVCIASSNCEDNANFMFVGFILFILCVYYVNYYVHFRLNIMLINYLNTLKV